MYAWNTDELEMKQWGSEKVSENRDDVREVLS